MTSASSSLSSSARRKSDSVFAARALGFVRGLDRLGEVAAVHVDDILDIHAGHGGELVDQLKTARVDAGDSDDDSVGGGLGGAGFLAGQKSRAAPAASEVPTKWRRVISGVM